MITNAFWDLDINVMHTLIHLSRLLSTLSTVLSDNHSEANLLTYSTCIFPD